MRVLIGCEYSGTVRDAFLRAGHEAMSCDLLPTEVPGPHYQGDIRDVLHYPWDLAVFHPPCTHLSVSGARHFGAKRTAGLQQAAVSFFLMLSRAPIPRIAIENPVCIMSSLWRKPDQIIQPWQFGHGETKATCLWLQGLPLLLPTCIVEGRVARIHRMPPGPERGKERSKTYRGIAEAMASQWGNFPNHNHKHHDRNNNAPRNDAPDGKSPGGGDAADREHPAQGGGPLFAYGESRQTQSSNGGTAG